MEVDFKAKKVSLVGIRGVVAAGSLLIVEKLREARGVWEVRWKGGGRRKE